MTLQTNNTPINEIETMRQYCTVLQKMPHYAKLGEAGIFAIVQKAKSMNVDPIEALNGGMYFVNGKVEMQGQMMLSLIRQAGHSVSMDPKSTDTHVTMRGKRADNGDMWIVDFSVEDAKKAGIYRGQWEKYPKTMCVWRCVSMLGRFLFPDVIKGCYVKGEIVESEPSFDVEPLEAAQKVDVSELVALYDKCSEDFQKKMAAWLKNQLGVVSFAEVPADMLDKLKLAMTNHLDAQEKEPEQEVEENVG